MQPGSLGPALHSQLPDSSSQCRVWVGGDHEERMDINCMEALIQDLVFHRVENKLLSHVLHTRSAVSRGFRESSGFRELH